MIRLELTRDEFVGLYTAADARVDECYYAYDDPRKPFWQDEESWERELAERKATLDVLARYQLLFSVVRDDL